MKRTLVALLLTLSLAPLSIILSQSRPRRVSETTATPSASAQRPVMGGSPSTAPQASQQPQTSEKSGPEEIDGGDVIRVNTTLVTIPVSVQDRDGRYIPDLRKDDFRVWEDGVEQQVAFFSSVDKPFSVVLMLDTSPSTQFRLEDIQDAAIDFINQLRPDDKVMVVSFDNDIKMLADFTNDRSKLQHAIQRTHTGDGTRLYDAIDMVMNQRLSRVTGRKAVVLFTDGVDTTSKHASYESTLTDAEELDALIYPVQYNTAGDIGVAPQFPSGYPTDVWGQILGGIFGGGRRGGRGGAGGPMGGGRGNSRDDYQLADRYLRELADNTGGRDYPADTMQNLSYAFEHVAEELRRQYSIGYYPKRPPQPGQRRQIRVRANQPNLAVRARDSYIFNPSGTAVTDEASQVKPVLRKFAAEGSRNRTFNH
ncbi:MAG: VWA domain-containing protein [Pyrinomonadaceae bacterium]